MKVVPASGEILSTLTGFVGALNIQETVRSTQLSSVDNVDSLPQQLKHGALNFHGHIYEFNTGEGIFIHSDVEKYKRDFKASVCSTFTSTTSLPDFDKWVDEQRSLFTTDNYNIVSNNCTHFIFNACEFLKIPKPDEFVKQQEFLEKNSNEVQILSPLLGQTRAKQFQGQEAAGASSNQPNNPQ